MPGLQIALDVAGIVVHVVGIGVTLWALSAVRR
jgi:uncharacterized membrane protein YwzB